MHSVNEMAGNPANSGYLIRDLLDKSNAAQCGPYSISGHLFPGGQEIPVSTMLTRSLFLRNQPQQNLHISIDLYLFLCHLPLGGSHGNLLNETADQIMALWNQAQGVGPVFVKSM